jgi:hypothetical protein
MNSFPVPAKSIESDVSSPENAQNERAIVLQELEKILASRHFKSSDRSKQFLSFVVFSRLEGQTERLKERTIGTEVFHRPPGYATGEDPVVRVQAGEVRRRLEQYYQELQQPPSLRIELPVGSYSPVFHWGPAPKARDLQPRAAIPAAIPAPRWKPFLSVAIAVGLVVLIVFGARTFYYSSHHAAYSKTILDQFWGPAVASQQPVLICIANATDHSAEEELLLLRARLRASQAENKGVATPLPPGTDEEITNDGLPISPEIVPAADASVAFALSSLFGRLQRPSQLRIGTAATYEDLRNFPAVIIGGFNSRWTMQLVSNLHFAFLRDHGQYMIREEVPAGRVWTTRLGPNGETIEDFAIVGRLVDSKTGQFTVTVAGIGPRGTQAAGEFVTSTRYLQEGLAGVPADWQNRNMEVLLQTTVTDSMAGPPRVIAAYAW